MNILGVDYGKKRIGLAWVDSDIGVITPFGIVNSDQGTVNKLAGIITDEHINVVVVGLPLGLDGKENENTERVIGFCNRLRSVVRSSVVTIDERFSSAEADRMEGGVSRDEKAAMIILESYLKSRKVMR